MSLVVIGMLCVVSVSWTALSVHASVSDGWQRPIDSEMSAVIVGPDSAPRVQNCNSDSQESLQFNSEGVVQFSIESSSSRALDFGCANYTAFGSYELGSLISRDNKTLALARSNSSLVTSDIIQAYSSSGLLLWEYFALDECNAPAIITSRPVVYDGVVTYIFQSCQSTGWQYEYVLVGISATTQQELYRENLGPIGNITNLSWYEGGVTFATSSGWSYIDSSGTSSLMQAISVSSNQQIAQDVDGTGIYIVPDPVDATSCLIVFEPVIGNPIERPSDCSEYPNGSVATLPNGDLVGLVHATGSTNVRIVHKGGQADTNVTVPVPAAADSGVSAPMRLQVDANGKIVVFSVFTEAKAISWWPFSQSYQRTAIDVFEQDGTHESHWSSASLGDESIHVDYDIGVALANGAIYLVDQINYQLIKVVAPGVSLSYRDSVRWNVAGVALPTKLNYVALGDSFSSGEGVEPFIDGTDTVGNRCHRSELAYPRLLALDITLNLRLNSEDFVACSGAETENVSTIGQWNESEQMSRLTSETDIVTITIGGNDIGFRGFATACVTGLCDIGSAAYNEALNNVNTILPALLPITYTQILSKLPSGADLYVLSYPHVAPVKTSADLVRSECPYLYNGNKGSGTNVVLDPWGNARGAYDITARINAQIESAVADVRLNDDRIHFIHTNAINSPFDGHDVCADESYFMNVNTDLPSIFHPNEYGQDALVDILKSEIQ